MSTGVCATFCHTTLMWDGAGLVARWAITHTGMLPPFLQWAEGWRSTEKSHGWCLERNLPSKSALDSSTVGFQLCLWNKTCLFKSCPVPLVTIWHAFLKWRAMEWAEMGARGYGLCAVFCGTLKTQLYQNRQYHNSQAVNTKSEVSTGNAKKV